MIIHILEILECSDADDIGKSFQCYCKHKPIPMAKNTKHCLIASVSDLLAFCNLTLNYFKCESMSVRNINLHNRRSFHFISLFISQKCFLSSSTDTKIASRQQTNLVKNTLTKLPNVL